MDLNPTPIAGYVGSASETTRNASPRTEHRRLLLLLLGFLALVTLPGISYRRWVWDATVHGRFIGDLHRNYTFGEAAIDGGFLNLYEDQVRDDPPRDQKIDYAVFATGVGAICVGRSVGLCVIIWLFSFLTIVQTALCMLSGRGPAPATELFFSAGALRFYQSLCPGLSYPAVLAAGVLMGAGRPSSRSSSAGRSG